MKLLIATFNAGKLAEYKLIFQDLGLPIQLVFLEDLGIKEKLKEIGKSFEENAILKARFYYQLAKIPTLADDGGIEIDYLGGEPGVKSRRWPGYTATDEELVEIALEKLKGVPLEKRGAKFKVVIAIAFSKNNIHTSDGELKGILLEKPTKIVPGYPFRSLFYLPEIGKTLGELRMEEEARVAHRKKALEKALPILKKLEN